MQKGSNPRRRTVFATTLHIDVTRKFMDQIDKMADDYESNRSSMARFLLKKGIQAMEIEEMQRDRLY